jgi:hypothetical protein
LFVVDRGIYNPANAPESELVTFHIDRFLNVETMDNQSVGWQNTTNWQDTYRKPQTVQIPSGVHTFTVKYNDGRRSSTFSITTSATFEATKEYIIKGSILGERVEIGIFEISNGEESTLNLNTVQADVLSKYSKYILDPTKDEVGNSVKLENNEMIILHKPDLSYILTDKKTGKVSEGRWGFIVEFPKLSEKGGIGLNVDFSRMIGKAYLLEMDITKMSKDQLQKIKYTETSQIILVPVKCNAESVTYKYEKPENIKDTEVTFSILEIKPQKNESL